MTTQNTMRYSDYLRLDALLAQQIVQSDEHDELLFIVIHQVYELWFKQILHELGALRRALQADDTQAALAALKRVLTIQKTLVAQVDVLETMTPLSFGAFRDRLQTASGFQSAQFRAIEFALGHRRREPLAAYAADSAARRQLEAMLTEPSVYGVFLGWLARRGLPIPGAALARPVEQGNVADEAVQAVLIEVYRHHPLEAQVCERLVDVDEGLQEWRYRHVKMVERTIGFKPGTGGSAGAAYLRETLFRPLFPDLWAIRSQL